MSTHTQFTFTTETLAQLVTVSANKNAAVAMAAREAALAKLNQRDFGKALQDASASLGCASAIYGVALTMAKAGAALEEIEKGMASKASSMREEARVKKEEADKAKAERTASDNGGIGNLKNLTPLEQAKEAVKKAEDHVLDCMAQLDKAQTAVAAALVNLANIEKAENAAAIELRAMNEARKEVAPILAIVHELKPLSVKDAEAAFKAQRDAVHAAKKTKVA